MKQFLWSISTCLVLACCVSILIGDRARGQGAAKALTVTQLDIVNAKGTPVIRLSTDAQGHGLIVLSDEYGEPVFQITSATLIGQSSIGPIANTRATIATRTGQVIIRTGQGTYQSAISIGADAPGGQLIRAKFSPIGINETP
jgi:hypothetical protein